MRPGFIRICLFPLVLVSGSFAAAAARAGDVSSPQRSAAKDTAKASVQRYDDAEVQKYPWGWIRWVMNAKIDPRAATTIGVVFIEPNQANPLHIHSNCNEYLHVLAGTCEHLLGDKWVQLKAGDTLRIPKGVPHMARTSKESCRTIVVYDTGERQMVVVEKKD